MASRTTKRKRAAARTRPSATVTTGAADPQAAILARLNGLIFLLAETLPRPTADADKSTRARKVKPLSGSEELNVRLAKAGLGPSEIAALTGRTRNNISRDLSKARKQGRLPRAK